jgi:hypothetical protein
MDEAHARGGKEGCRHVGKIFAKGPERQMKISTRLKIFVMQKPFFSLIIFSSYESIFFQNIGISKVTAS